MSEEERGGQSARFHEAALVKPEGFPGDGCCRWLVPCPAVPRPFRSPFLGLRTALGLLGQAPSR